MSKSKRIFLRSFHRNLAVSLLIFISIVGSYSNARADSKDPFIYVLEGEALGGYSKTSGRNGIFATVDNWLFSPTVRLSDNLHWINIYNGSYDRETQVISQEEGGAPANTTQEHNLTSSLKYDVNDSWSLRPLFFVDWVFVNETKDEKFGKGLYDYRDIGGGIESQWITLKTKDRQDDVRLGFRYLNREYPNYLSLLSLYDPNGSAETHEKDLNGYKFNLSHDTRVKQGWSWGAEGIFFYKDYTDKKTINFNGIRTNDNRQDFVEYLNIYASRPLNEEWTFRLNSQFAINESNLDFYDTHNTPTFADDNFIKNYYDYFSFLAQPVLTYTKNIEKDKDLLVTASYAFYAVHYPGRKIQDISGNYLTPDEQDYTHTFTAKASYPLTKNISWVLSGTYTLSDSNQKFESFYLYNYELWTAVTGISFKF